MHTGDEGESLVQKVLDLLPREVYTPIHKLIITSEDDSSEIDHVLVSIYGIFIIETKNHVGVIEGDTFKSVWTQHKGNERRFFQNPVRQNWSHVKSIEKLFPDRGEDQFIPIVVFSNKEVELNIASPANPVVKLENLPQLIASYRTRRIDIRDIDYIVKVLRHYYNVNRAKREAHIDIVKRKLQKKRQMVRKGICPNCGGKIITKIDSYGQFLACEECDFISTE